MSGYLETIFGSLKNTNYYWRFYFSVCTGYSKRTTEKTIKALFLKENRHAARTAFINRCFSITYFSFLFAVYIIVN